MAPMHPPTGMLAVARAALAFAFALLVTAVPLVAVQACSCASSPLPEAVGAADMAFVGTSMGSVAIGRDDIGERVVTTWTVERSRDPIDGSSVAIESWADSGANCGISFAAGERWLVVAYAEDGVLKSNGCMQNRPLDGSDPEADIVIADVMTEVPGPPVDAGFALDVPAPMIAIVAAVILIGATSALAFRRTAR